MMLGALMADALKRHMRRAHMHNAEHAQQNTSAPPPHARGDTAYNAAYTHAVAAERPEEGSQG
jgi:hypothetical protein